MGDADGVIVVPREVEAEALEAAFEKLRGERTTLAELQAGAQQLEQRRLGTRLGLDQVHDAEVAVGRVIAEGQIAVGNGGRALAVS